MLRRVLIMAAVNSKGDRRGLGGAGHSPHADSAASRLDQRLRRAPAADNSHRLGSLIKMHRSGTTRVVTPGPLRFWWHRSSDPVTLPWETSRSEVRAPDDARVTERSSRHPTRPSFQATVTLTRQRLGAKAASPDVGASPGGGGATGGSTDVASSFATDASSILTWDAALPAIAAEDSCDGGISAR
jgi:hypothetical protein